MDVSHEEKVRIGGRLEVRTLHRKERILDDDLPDIAKAYAEFRAQHPEPREMITRLEATRYRCFERLGVDVGDFRVLVGANGSGKTTLLDLPVLLRRLAAREQRRHALHGAAAGACRRARAA